MNKLVADFVGVPRFFHWVLMLQLLVVLSLCFSSIAAERESEARTPLVSSTEYPDSAKSSLPPTSAPPPPPAPTLSAEDNEFECLSFPLKSRVSDENLKLFNTKTTYLNARRTIHARTNVTWPVPATCKAVHLHFFSRHAIRYPNLKVLSKFYRQLPPLRDSIISANGIDLSLVQEFMNWKLHMNDSLQNLVTDSGRWETGVVAQIFADYFPDLLDIDKVDLEIGVTTKIRTTETADAFLRSLVKSQLMRRDGVDNNSVETQINEKMNKFEFKTKPVLLSHRACKAKVYENERSRRIVKDKEAKVKDTMLGTEAMVRMLGEFSERNHFPVSLSFDSLFIIYQICSVEISMYDASPWCQLFTTNELKLLRYVVDRFKQHDAFGFPHYRQQACPFVSDVIDKIDTFLGERASHNIRGSNEQSQKPRTILDFSHQTLLGRLISHLELNELCPMMVHTNEHVCLPENRQFEASLLTPFGGNFAFALFECPEDESSSSSTSKVSHKLLTLLNEVPVKVGGCSDLFCDIDQFRERYKTDTCNLDRICHL